MRGLRAIGCGLLFGVLLLGCQPAQRIPPPPEPVSTGRLAGDSPQPPEVLDPRLYWQPDLNHNGDDNIPLVFVSATKDGARWAALPEFWNPTPLVDPRGAAALFHPDPLTVALTIAAVGPARVAIKVPLGLEDPTPFLLADDPPTLGKWQLGRRLFFDTDYLTPAKNLSCATCHDPAAQFASRQARDPASSVHTPSLRNVVYQPRIFWDGRGEVLEACMQRTLNDEREPTPPGKHVWGGAIRRLLVSGYQREFVSVFGVSPDQDNVGRALATYCRTLLSGNSLYDRVAAAARKAGKKEPDAALYEAVLRPADLAALGRASAKASEVARDLYRGDLLFHDRLVESPTACVVCHGGPLFTDKGYHNLGLDPTSTPTEDPGRMAALPPGRRSAAAQGAYRTPSLRDVARRAYYFHTGASNSLQEAVLFQLEGAHWTTYTDPIFLTADGKNRLPRNLHPTEVAALLLFLRSLNGDDPPPILIQR